MDAARVWRDAKHVLLPYQGAVSEIDVLDVPVSEYGTVMDLFTEFADEVEVVGYRDEPVLLDVTLRAALVVHSDKTTTHFLWGRHNERERVKLFLVINSDSKTFDAEIVFHANQLFPEADDEWACFHVFEQYFVLAEKIRSLSPESPCVLHTLGNPRRDRGKPWTYSW